MKKSISFILLFAVLVMGITPLAMAQSSKVRLQGAIKGLPVGAKVYLRAVQGNKIVPFDSVQLAAGSTYQFEMQQDKEEFYVLELGVQRSPNIHVILLPGDNVKVDMRYSPEWNHLRIIGTKGSRNMEMYRRFNNLIPSGQDDAAQWNLKVNVSELITEYADCLMSAFLVTFFEEDFSDYGWVYKVVRDALVPIYPNNDFVRHVDEKVRNAIVPGMQAPDVVLNDPDGKPRKLSDLRGKVVLLDFWASWCGPCRKENPNVVKIYDRYKDKGFDIFSVSLDNKKEAWLKAIKDDGLVWPNHVSDLRGWSSAGGKVYGISSVPATVLIDRDGAIIARNLRGPALAAKLAELLD